MKKLKLIVVLLSLFSCKQEIEYDFDEPNVTKITIPIDENYLNSYQVWQTFKEIDQNNLIAYNNRKHTLDFFALDNEKVLRQVQLNYEGPNGVGEISSLYYHNPDSIFLYERSKLHIINSDGQLANTYSLYDYFEGLEGGEPICNFYFKLKYDSDSKSIPFYLLYNQAQQNEKSSKPLIGLFNLEKESVDLLPIYHTDFFKKNSNGVGFITYLGFHGFMNQGLLYNFQYESTIFLFGKNGDLKESNDTKTISPMVDESTIEAHAIRNTHYLTPIFDPWKNLIYRFNWESPKNEDGGFIDKETTLDIYGDDLKMKTHTFLPEYTYQINNWFVNERGLYLNVAHPKNPNIKEDELVFHVYDFAN